MKSNIRAFVFLNCTFSLFLGSIRASDEAFSNRGVPSRVSFDNIKYLDLLSECQNDRLNKKQMVTIQTITNSVNPGLLRTYESPLNQLANASIADVVWYGNIVVSNILNTSGYTQKTNQVCDMCCWLIIGLRRECFLECKVAALTYEKTLLQSAISADNLNPYLRTVFETDWLPNTAAFIEYKCDNLKILSGKGGVLKNIDLEFMQIIMELKRVKKCDYVKSLECANALKMRIESGPSNYFSKQLCGLIEKLLIPDLELHILKQKFRQKTGTE